ncbi:hypothetical protein WAF17_05800 [Bernardetia sp. ABR2-2B]|uniref:hypothetical protein n=1 Tax=Bernardetia sp. ABR2-2B TaxID=3127472 RepID=UPI0030D1CBF4
MSRLFFVIKVFFVSLFAFFIINATTLTFEAYFDGYNKIGYPFIFYQSTGGKCLNCDAANFFKVDYLMFDFSITIIIVLLIFFLYDRKSLSLFPKKCVLITLSSVLLALLQSYLFHIGTSCYAHEIFSVYFFIELFIFLLVILSGFESKLSILLYFIAFLLETTYFSLNDLLPIQPNLILIIGILRVYIFFILFKDIISKKTI